MIHYELKFPVYKLQSNSSSSVIQQLQAKSLVFRPSATAPIADS